MSEERSTIWTFIVYPDSAPTGWKQLLKYYYVPFAVSPLHQPESEGTDQEKLKEHWHVMLNFDSLKSFKQVEYISSTVNATRPQIVHSGTGMFQYLVHLNEPPEVQHWKNGLDEIELFNGFDKDKFSEYTEKQVDAINKQVLQFIEDNNITEFHQLIDFLRFEDLGIEGLFRLVRKQSNFFTLYINSVRNHKNDITAKSLEERLKIVEELIKYGK